MTNVNIFDTNADAFIAEGLEDWGITDCLINAFCDDNTPDEIREACESLGDAYMKGEPTNAWEAYLGVEITTC
jgi:hypothetical protein